MKIFHPLFLLSLPWSGVKSLPIKEGSGDSAEVASGTGELDAITMSTQKPLNFTLPISVRDSECRPYQSIEELAAESDRPFRIGGSDKLDKYARLNMIDDIAYKLTSRCQDMRVNAILFPAVRWPQSLDLKYCIYNDAVREDVKQIFTDAIHSVANLHGEGEAAVDASPHALDSDGIRAVQYVMRQLSTHTPFNLIQVDSEDQADIVLAKNTWCPPGVSGIYRDNVDTFIGNVTFKSRFDLEKKIKALMNDEGQGKKVIVLFDENLANMEPAIHSSDAQPGDLYYQRIFHEVLHALGLNHPQIDDPLDISQGSVIGKLTISQNAVENTIMANSKYPVAGDRSMSLKKTKQYPQYISPLDVAALHFIAENIICKQNAYQQGLSTSAVMHKSPFWGDTVYRFTSDRWLEVLNRRCIPDTAQANHLQCTETGQMIDLESRHLGHIQQTLVDPGGIDEYDISQLDENIISDLSAGGGTILFAEKLASSRNDYGQTYKVSANIYQPVLVSHAEDYLIENIKTGSGDDIVVGNQLNNRFDLGGGFNAVLGGEGKDKFYLGASPGKLHIMDFQVGSGGDQLELDSHFGIFNLEQLRQRARVTTIADASGLEIILDSQRSIFLNNVMDIDLLHQDNLQVNPDEVTSSETPILQPVLD